MKLYFNRRHAGRVLAERLLEYAGRSDVIVLALPRGGVPVGYEVALALRAPLDVLTVRKIGVPWNEEFALGAIASGDLTYIDEHLVQDLGLSRLDVAQTIARERRELARRDLLYRAGQPFPNLDGRCVILVDDGLATGSTMRAAVLAVRQSHPSLVVAAAPVASREACRALADVTDNTVCAEVPEPFYGVGLWYGDFSETSDQEVLELLEHAASARLEPAPAT